VRTTAEIVTAYVAALNAGSPDLVVRFVTDDFHNEHTSSLGQSVVGKAAYRERLDAFLSSFTHLSYEIEDVIVDGERAAVPYRMHAVVDGRPIVIRGMFRFRVTNGLIAHRVDYWDSSEFVRQTQR
jgi:steroid delta-isomerase-like uncharacterized protein